MNISNYVYVNRLHYSEGARAPLSNDMDFIDIKYEVVKKYK